MRPWYSERGDGAGFAAEARGELLIAGQVGMQNFDGNVPIEIGLVGFVDLRHSTLSEFLDQTILAECRANQSRYACRHRVRHRWFSAFRIIRHRFLQHWSWL
jgi:hypothetical protein